MQLGDLTVVSTTPPPAKLAKALAVLGAHLRPLCAMTLADHWRG